MFVGGQFGHQPDRQPQSDEADRDVDEKDPGPAHRVHQHTAGQRSDQRGHSRGGAPHARRHPAAVGREDPGDQRQRLRAHYRGADALGHPRRDQHGDGARQATPQRGGGKDGQADQIQVLRAEPVTEPTGHQQRDRVGQQVRTGHPDDRVVAGAEADHDAGIGDRDDRRVEQDHEEADHHRPQRMPWVDLVSALGRRASARSPTSSRRGHIPAPSVCCRLGRSDRIELAKPRSQESSACVVASK